MSELPATKTSPTIAEVAQGVRDAWGKVFGLDAVVSPSPQTVALVVAHSALETAFWHSMYDWNFGNAKSAGKVGDFTFYTCGENLPNAEAKALLAADPAHVHLSPATQNSEAATLALGFLPPHPMCRFMAFASLADGMEAHLRMLRNVFPRCLPALVAGDAPTYAKALKSSGYYTAPEAGYEAGLVRCLAQAKRELGIVDPQPALPPPPPPAPDAVAPTLEKPAAPPPSPAPPPAAAPEAPKPSTKDRTVLSAIVLLVGAVVALFARHC